MRFGGILAVVTLLGAGCLVDRKSDKLACGENDSCPAGRRCETGYCVVGVDDGPRLDSSTGCPSPCDSCDVMAKTCQVICDSPNGCGVVACPAGYQCTINCEAPSACGTIDCRDGASCQIQCSGNNACGPITCGLGPCNVACASSNSCDVIACAESCRCDVACGAGSCGTNACPQANGTPCTLDQTNGSTCRSSATGCNTCP